MNTRFKYLFASVLYVVFLYPIHIDTLFAQTSEEQIRMVREASNAALKALDEEANFEFLTDDVLITTGNGTLISGKDELRYYIAAASDSQPMYWVRTPGEIRVNEDRGLAWETGVWNGYDAGTDESVISGNYAAQWIRVSGEWKIQSQLFVTLWENED